MGLFKDILDAASGGAISMLEDQWEGSKAMCEALEWQNKLERFEEANNEFDVWFRGNLNNYNELYKKYKCRNYIVDRSILHSPDDKGDFYKEEKEENERRKKKLEDAIRDLQLAELMKDNAKFQGWFNKYSRSYEDLCKSINDYSFMVSSKVFNDDEEYPEVDEENEKRYNQIEKRIEELSFDYLKRRFRDYLVSTEQTVLDSYNTYRIFQVEMSYLFAYQKECVDLLYLSQISKLYDNENFEDAFSFFNDLAWQIERHKIPGGHAIVLLVLAQNVYKDDSGFSDEMKSRINEILAKTEDIIINNTYKKYHNDDPDDMSAEEMLKKGKEAFISGKPEKAFAYYLSAAQKGNTEAQYRTGVCFEKGLGVFNNGEKAIYWYKKSSENDDPIGKYYLATVYHWMLPENQQDYKKALDLYKKTFEEGVAEAADNIGNMYLSGQGVEQSATTAFKWYEKGATAGSPWAMFDLYKSYLNGNGTAKNDELAKQWLEKTKSLFEIDGNKCENFLIVGCEGLMSKIAYEYFGGSSIFSSSEDQAIVWAKKGAMIGDIKSMDLLSILYCKQGKNEEAVKYMNCAANYGFSWSMNSLGKKYFDDDDETLNTDKVLAFEMFSRGAKFGNSLSQLNIAYAFMLGNMVVSVDKSEARHWFALSAKQGNETSRKMIDALDSADAAKHKFEVEKEKEKISAKIAEIDMKIENAQSQREEDELIKEKNALKDEMAKLA